VSATGERLSEMSGAAPTADAAAPACQPAHKRARWSTLTPAWRGVRGYARRVAPLALGHGVSRLAAFALVVFIGRFLGAEALGEFSLAHALGQYVMLGSDLGTKAIGARTVAVDPSAAAAVLPVALRKMVILAMVGSAITITYSRFGPVPAQWRWFLAVFVLSATPYALNIDWLFWGLERFDLFAWWQGGVYSAYAALAITLSIAAKRSLYGVAAGHAIAWVGGASFLWLCWTRTKKLLPEVARERSSLPAQVPWRSILALGSTGVAAMVLDSASLLVLGAFGTPRAIGEYGAATKLLAPILGLQTVLYFGVYPWLARRRPLAQGERSIAWLLPASAGLLGVAVAAPLAIGARPIAVLCFGQSYASVAVPLRALCPLIPFALAAIVIRAILIAHQHDTLAMAGVVAGVLVSLALSGLLVPRHGPVGAACATSGAYAASALVSLVTLWIAGRRSYAASSTPRIRTGLQA
jgi:O-antigen/teichoic acid export membrane protein